MEGQNDKKYGKYAAVVAAYSNFFDADWDVTKIEKGGCSA